MSFEDRVRDVEKRMEKDTLIYANLRPAQNAAQWKTGEVVPFTLSDDLPARHEPDRIQGV